MSAPDSSEMVFGPVFSRRLGNSLGIKNVQAKCCTYSCRYCQAGATRHMTLVRQSSYSLAPLLAQVAKKLEQTISDKVKVDYLSVVPDGEPTLDEGLGELVEALQEFNLPVAVISNASLLYLSSVQKALQKAQWLSLKIDSVTEDVWRRLDRPHGHLELEKVKNGLLDFSRNFKGKLVTETMLVKGFNDNEGEMTKIGEFIANVKPATAYVSIPTRPPIDSTVNAPEERKLFACCGVLKTSMAATPIELLNARDGANFPNLGGDVIANILAITSVHPLREEVLRSLLRKANIDFSSIADMVDKGSLARRLYGNEVYYVNLEK